MELKIDKFREECYNITKTLRDIITLKITNEHPKSKNVSNTSADGLISDVQEWYNNVYNRVLILLSKDYKNIIKQPDMFTDVIAEEDRVEFAKELVLLDEDLKSFNNILRDLGCVGIDLSYYVFEARSVLSQIKPVSQYEHLFAKGELTKNDMWMKTAGMMYNVEDSCSCGRCKGQEITKDSKFCWWEVL